MSVTPARKLTTSAMIASFADAGQRTTSAPFGHALAGVQGVDADEWQTARDQLEEGHHQ